VAQPARTIEPRTAPVDEPPLDPLAIEDAYRKHRAARAARVQRKRAKVRAGVRFWALLVIGIAVAVLLAARTMGEIERVFGL